MEYVIEHYKRNYLDEHLKSTFNNTEWLEEKLKDVNSCTDINSLDDRKIFILVNMINYSPDPYNSNAYEILKDIFEKINNECFNNWYATANMCKKWTADYLIALDNKL